MNRSRAVLLLTVMTVALVMVASPAWAATFTVDTTGDPIPVGGAGNCTAAPGDCSLRGAIEGLHCADFPPANPNAS